MIEQDYYALLGLEPMASLTEIKRAYRKLARKFHPDSGHPESSRDNFEKITRAYEVLSVPQRRLAYDAKYGFHPKDSISDSSSRHAATSSAEQLRNAFKNYSAAAETLGGAAARPATPNSARYAKKESASVTESDISSKDPSVMSKLSGLLNPLIKSAGNKARKHAQKRARSQAERVSEQLRGSREYNFTVDALESIHGTTREIAFESGDSPRVIRIKIPANVVDGNVLKIDVPGEGMIRVQVRIRSHPLVERDGYDLIVKLPITIAEAINGTELEIPTLSGPVKVKLPPKSGDAKRLRLKGRGLPQPTLNENGDLYLETYILPPDVISSSAKDAAAALEAHYREPVRKNVPKKL